jgi:hypothetical protein
MEILYNNEMFYLHCSTQGIHRLQLFNTILLICYRNTSSVVELDPHGAKLIWIS